MTGAMMRYFLATRPWSLTASFMPAVLGIVLSYKDYGKMHLAVAKLTILSVLLVHIAANLVNSYYDFVNGVDTDVSDDRTLVDKVLAPDVVIKLAAVLYAVSFAIFVFLISSLDKDHIVYLLCLFGSGCILSFLYTGGIALKYHALGDVVICLTFGPLVTCYTYTTHFSPTEFPWKPILFSLPMVMITEAILHGNNVRDMGQDRKCGIVTLPIILGDKISRYLFSILLILPFFNVLYMTYAFSFWFLLPFLSISALVCLLSKFSDHDLQFIAQETAKFHSVFGVLYLIAVILS